jgi:2-dehydro-3-deoxyphosphogluconate aldolase/(4S)-4-hydroxy-2-oxoglutarate aldolase
VELIAELAPGAGGRVGAGTVLGVDQARRCIAAGAGYLVSPCTDLAVLEVAVSEGVPLVSGAATPTEIQRAHLAGAAAVKLFPINLLGGVAFVRAVREPMPEPRLVVSGGVTVEQLADLFAVGVHAACLGREIIDGDAAAAGDVDAVAAQASRVLAAAGVAVSRSMVVP